MELGLIMKYSKSRYKVSSKIFILVLCKPFVLEIILAILFLSVRGQGVISSTRGTSTKYNLLVIHFHN